MRTSDDVSAIYPALIKVQGELPEIVKNKENPFFKSQYADLPGIVSQCAPVLAENSMTVIQGADSIDGQPWLFMRIIHESGQWVESGMPLLMTKKDPQGVGSAVTYARRYLYCSMLGLTPDEDDDGNAAQESGAKQGKKPTQQTDDDDQLDF
jgi:hypothetical protein